MSTVATDTLATVTRLGNNLDDLRKFAHGPQDRIAVEGSEAAFGWIVDALWELDPSDFPARVLHALDGMPNEMRRHFDEWLDREGHILPQSKGGGGGTVRWVIAPEF